MSSRPPFLTTWASWFFIAGAARKNRDPKKPPTSHAQVCRIYLYQQRYISIYLSICLSINLSIYLSIYLPICLSIYPSIYICVRDPGQVCEVYPYTLNPKTLNPYNEGFWMSWGLWSLPTLHSAFFERDEFGHGPVERSAQGYVA